MTPEQAWVEDIRERLRADFHPFQADAASDPSKRISLLWGRGVGKTSILRARALDIMVSTQGAMIPYVATSRPTARRLNWNPLKALLDALAIADDFSFHETRMECTCLRTGSIYMFIGADDVSEVEKLRGSPFNEVQIDECGSHDNELLEYMLDECVTPRLGERKGVILLAGTPGQVPRGRFFDVTAPGQALHRAYTDRDDQLYDKWIGWSSHYCELPMVVELPNAVERYPAMMLNWAAALEEKERQQWGDDNPKWLREYRARWARNDTTSIYSYRAHNADGSLKNRWEPLEGQKLEGVAMLKAAIAKLPDEFVDYLYGYGADLGARDPFALNIIAFSPSDPRRRYWHVLSFERREMYVRLIAELLIGEEAVKLAMRGEVYTEVGGCFGVTGWPVAAVADLAGLGETIILELQKVYGITFKAAEKKGKFGAFEVVNGDLVDDRMYILADTPLELQLSSLQWKPDEYGQPKEDKGAPNHSADSLTYIRVELGNMFTAPPAAKTAPKPEERQRAPAEPPKPRKVAPPKRNDPEDLPRGSKARGAGEWDSLLSDNEWNMED